MGKEEKRLIQKKASGFSTTDDTHFEGLKRNCGKSIPSLKSVGFPFISTSGEEAVAVCVIQS